MNLKTLFYGILCSQILLLTACIDFRPWEYRPKKSTTPKLLDARGGWVSPCGADYAMKRDNGHAYLRNHGLPVEIEGNFICTADNKPALPKDCQGKEIRSVEELESFRLKHQLPLGYLYWECSNGVPKVEEQYLENWHRNELERPTCKDERGRPKPCV